MLEAIWADRAEGDGEHDACWTGTAAGDRWRRISGKVERGRGNIAATSLQVSSLDTRCTGGEAGSYTKESELSALGVDWQ
jgi:hypothetical protein